ncbi:neocarzinostatin apoprotein domain-containing protein [Gordonia sp. VNK21]|uniref:neocarzinostatin apoprotein domain-containing protein n=1 Tax=Gordonia sp. VNK21 TaxID=3382483 RepID=UPI0038D35DD3
MRALLAAFLSAAAVLLVCAPAAAPARPVTGPTLTATPATGLTTGDEVTIRGSGYRAHQQLYVFEGIKLPAVGVPVGHVGKKRVQTDGTGAFRTSITVRRTLPGVDCVRTRCYISTLAALPNGAVDRSQDASARLTFTGGSGATDAAAPKLSVKPATQLRQGTVMKVAGSGFVPRSRLHVVQTVAEPQNSRPTEHTAPVTVTADEQGRFAAELKAQPIFRDTNCLQTRCFVAAYSERPETGGTVNHAWTPIAFDPSDQTTLALDEENIEQAGTAVITVDGAQPHDLYRVAVEGPDYLSAQPWVRADADGHARVLVMTDFDQGLGTYRARLTTERTGAVTEVDFNVGTNALFNPAQNSGEEIADPTEMPSPPAVEIAEPAPPADDKSFNTLWLLPLAVLMIAVIAWYSRDEPDPAQAHRPDAH